MYADEKVYPDGSRDLILRQMRSLDREHRASYNFLVNVEDRGTPSRLTAKVWEKYTAARTVQYALLSAEMYYIIVNSKLWRLQEIKDCLISQVDLYFLAEYNLTYFLINLLVPY